MSWRRRLQAPAVTSLDLHPNLAEILAVLSQVPRLTERDIAELAAAWRDTTYLSVARDHALAPDSPLVVEVLAAFERVDAVFREELSASDDALFAHGSGATVKPHVVSTALKAVRDALAAAYARPVLARAEHTALMAPWRRVVAANGSPSARS
jgi:hypothetical protein